MIIENMKKGELDNLAKTRCRKEGMISVHLVASTVEGSFLLVKNKEKILPVLKREGWGIPTGKCPVNLTPLEQVGEELKEETGLSPNDLSSIETLYATRKPNGHIDIFFTGSLDSFSEIPEKINDPADGVTAVCLVRPEEIVKEGNNYFFRNLRIYRSSIEALKASGIKIP